MKSKIVDYVVNDQMIDGEDSFAIIQPVWSYADIYGSLEEYEASLAPFTRSQRIVFAVRWYFSEVYNGGHDQFFFNSTGIVWPDALEGLRAIGATEAAQILSESVSRFEGEPSRERQERIEQLDQQKLNFDDLDDRLYDVEEDVDALILQYARENRQDFYFEGRVEVYELPDISD